MFAPRDVWRFSKKSAFTLAELIIVIVILAILSTIAMVAYQSYAASSRDSARAADINSLSKAITLFGTKSGKFPNPDGMVSVTYSGASVWSQGTIGSWMILTLQSGLSGGGVVGNGGMFGSSGGGSSGAGGKRVLDPLDGSEYLYSVLSLGSAFQIKGEFENAPLAVSSKRGDKEDSKMIAKVDGEALGVDSGIGGGNSFDGVDRGFDGEAWVGVRSGIRVRDGADWVNGARWVSEETLPSLFVEDAYAYSTGSMSRYASVRGNYNWLAVKVATGGLTYVLATPGIVADLTGSVDIGTLSGKLFLNGKKIADTPAFTPVMVYSTGSFPTASDDTWMKTIMSAVRWAYSGSSLATGEQTVVGLMSTTDSLLPIVGRNIFGNGMGWGGSVFASVGSSSVSSVVNSLMLDSSTGNQYLSRTPSVAGNQKKWTWSGWVKRGKLGTWSPLFEWWSSASVRTTININSNDQIHFNGYTSVFTTSAVLRDPSAWYNILVIYDSDNGTPGDRVQIWVNWIRQTITGTYPNAGTQEYIWWNFVHYVGWANEGGWGYLDGYLADVSFVDSWALDASAFWQTDSTTGQWVPKSYSWDYGKNGFHLSFGSGGNLGLDDAPLTGSHTGANNWTTNGSPAQTIDTPTNNFAVLNPNDWGGTKPTVTQGNLTVTANASAHEYIRSTLALPRTGKWYWEVATTTTASAYSVHGIGVETTSWLANTPTKASSIYINNYWQSGNQNNIMNSVWGSVNVQTVNAWYTQAANDVLRFAYDATTGYLWMGNASGWFGGTGIYNGDPNTGVNPTDTLSGSYEWTPFSYPWWSQSERYYFGQMMLSWLTYSTWANGYFKYTPPTGFVALSSSNLPDPTIKNPKTQFDVATWIGDSTQWRVILLGFTPGLSWTKNRTSAYSNVITDSIRGWGKTSFSDSTTAELSSSVDGTTTSTTNGITLYGGSSTFGWVNTLSNNYISWNWKPGDSTVANTSGSVASQVSANTTAGFSIVSYTGNQTAGATVWHGLNTTPSFIVTKARGVISSWATYHKMTGPTNWLLLNSSQAQTTSAQEWNNTSPTSSVFTIGNSSANDNQSATNIAYVWSEVPGFSKFGSYTGNGSTDGPFVYTGFKPRWIMWKRSDSTGDWIIQDTARSTYNSSDSTLYPNLTAVEANGGWYPIDIVSNGFKIRGSAAYQNTTWGTYIYAAFAEAPFKYANAR